MQNKYYFSFDDIKSQPFKRGHLIVLAESKKQACDIFEAIHPSPNPDYIACADIYDEDEWNEYVVSKGYTSMLKCHEVISVSVTKCS